MSAAKLCVVGSLNVDLVAQVPRRPATGETVTGSAFRIELGGKGFNQAVAAGRTGAAVAMVGRVGADAWGDDLLAALEAEGVGRGAVLRNTETGTGVAVILVEDGGANSIVVVERANAALTAADVRAAAGAIAGSSVLLLQCEVPGTTVVAAAELARAGGTAVVLNTAPAALPVAAFRGLVDYVVANETEVQELTGIAADGEGASRAAAALRAESGARGVVLTLGARGALVDEGEQVLVPGHEVACVDSVGAGDAFCGAMGSALSRGGTLLEAVRFGNAAGALAVGSPGAAAAMPTRADVEALLDSAARA